MHDLLVGIAVDIYASAGVHTICVDAQIELDDILYRLGRYGLIRGYHLDGRASTSAHIRLLPDIYGYLGGKGRWFRIENLLRILSFVCVGYLFISPDVAVVVVLLLMIMSILLLLTCTDCAA